MNSIILLFASLSLFVCTVSGSTPSYVGAVQGNLFNHGDYWSGNPGIQFIALVSDNKQISSIFSFDMPDSSTSSSGFGSAKNLLYSENESALLEYISLNNYSLNGFSFSRIEASDESVIWGSREGQIRDLILGENIVIYIRRLNFIRYGNLDRDLYYTGEAPTLIANQTTISPVADSIQFTDYGTFPEEAFYSYKATVTVDSEEDLVLSFSTGPSLLMNSEFGPSPISYDSTNDNTLTLKYDILTEPLLPVLDLDTFYESNSGESITVDATPTDGYPTTYSYQWSYKAAVSSSYFVIPSNFGGTLANYQISGNSGNNGTWKVEVTNDTGITSAEFEFRVFTDADSDGLSDYREGNILGTDPNLADSDSDGLSDYDEVNTHYTNPLLSDTDSDGLPDNVETNTGIYVSETDTGTDPNNTDSDGDGLLDSVETNTGTDPNNADSDGDGVGDSVDTFPNDGSETVDTDSDGVGDNADAFDNDPTETTDADGDGVGANTDAFDNDPTETTDSDGDGVGDNADAFDNDPTESVDSDGDGFGDNADGFPNIPTQDIVNEIISNPSVYDLYSRDGTQDLRTNSTILDVSNNQATIQIQMEESSDLESWTETGDAATMVVPADSDTKFFRFKMAE